MKLRYSSTSPYVRKVMAVAMELGLADHITRVTTNSRADDSDIWADNPLGKVPALALDDRTVLIDSPVICRYLATVMVPGGAVVPADPKAAILDQNLEALADGICDAAVLRRLESSRPAAEQSAFELDRYAKKVAAALDRLETLAEGGMLSGVTIGTLATACALGYLDFRYPEEPWRPGHPALTAWEKAIGDRASLSQTKPA